MAKQVMARSRLAAPAASGNPFVRPPTHPKSAKPATSPEGIVKAIVAVTGTEDQVGDVITPGIFAASLAHRRPKVVFHHDFTDFAGRILHIEEWLPGDKRLPKLQPNGQPWPAAAGALVADMQFNMGTQRGREVYEWARFYAESGEAAWSIGYKVPPGMAAHRGGLRIIYGIDLFEVSLVLHGAHPLTMALEVKSAAMAVSGARATSEFETKETSLGLLEHKAAAWAVLEAKSIGTLVAAGLVVKAADTGRVLLLQRALNDDDPASGRWEFPGGHIEDGEDPLAAAAREWQEETGAALPAGKISASWDSPNGIYRGFVYVVPSEELLAINADHDDRLTINPDDPKGKQLEVTAWFDPVTLPDMPSLRDECRSTPWGDIATAGVIETKDSSPIGTPGGKQNWVDQTGGLPLYIREIAHALIRNGHDTSASIALAVGSVKRWAAGGDSVNPDTQAKAAAALAEWEAKKAAAHADNAIQTKSAPTPTDDLETKMARMSGSYEERRTLLADAINKKLRPKSTSAGDTAWYCSIEATFDDHVIVSVWADGAEIPNSFTIPYIYEGESLSLGEPTRVELMVVAEVESDQEEQAEVAEEASERLLVPAIASIENVADAITAGPLEYKGLDALRPALIGLLDALSAKGVDVPGLMFGEDDEDTTDEGAQWDKAREGALQDAGSDTAADPDADGDTTADTDGDGDGMGTPDGDQDPDDEENITVDPSTITDELDELRR